MSALPLARLTVRDGALQSELLARTRNIDVDFRNGHTGKIVGWSAAAIVSIFLVVVFGIPLVAQRLAPIIPYWFEARVGDVAERQIGLMVGRSTCSNPGGSAALNKLVEEIRVAGGLTAPTHTELLRSGTPNAFALPGGKVYVLSALLSRANSVDELAGVIAHELGHVQHRDYLRAAIQNGGTSFLVGLLFGDITGSGAAVFATRTALQTSYSRDVETQADRFAVEVMHKLGRSPKPLGDFLFRITGAEAGRSLGILASHPLTEARRDMLAKEDQPVTGPPLLSDAEWQDLKGICGQAAAARPPVRPNPPAAAPPQPSPTRPASSPQRPTPPYVSPTWPPANSSKAP
jgi:Zn-dependent protease with chaperone function